VVLAYLTAQQLRQFGADAYIVNILGVALVRELGPDAGGDPDRRPLRLGSITAQIGVMRVTDELDAMRVMGISHSYRLVMPRALALAIAMPLISVLDHVLPLAGGMLAADLALGITPDLLPARAARGGAIWATWCWRPVKSVVFGILIALIGCYFGLRCNPTPRAWARAPRRRW
jgi:phospholipid/cholesterol/gamma-HCH transport system permease protein